MFLGGGKKKREREKKKKRNSSRIRFPLNGSFFSYWSINASDDGLYISWILPDLRQFQKKQTMLILKTMINYWIIPLDFYQFFQQWILQ